jgi:hypothetical protein
MAAASAGITLYTAGTPNGKTFLGGRGGERHKGIVDLFFRACLHLACLCCLLRRWGGHGAIGVRAGNPAVAAVLLPTTAAARRLEGQHLSGRG